MAIGFVAAASFLAIRYALLHSGRGAVRSHVAAAAGAGLVIALFVVFATVFGGPAAAWNIANGGAGAEDAGLRGEAVHPPGLRLDPRELARLAPSPGAPGIGTIDLLNGLLADEPLHALRFARGSTIVIYGWAGDSSRKPGAALIAIVDRKRRFDITRFYGRHRIDVARAFGERGMEFSGFQDAAVPTNGLAAGRHQLTLGIVRADRAHYDPIPQIRWFELR